MPLKCTTHATAPRTELDRREVGPRFDSVALGPDVLAFSGAVLTVEIAIPHAVARALHAQGRPVPPPVRYLAQIDTGASRCGADESVFQTLGLPPSGTVCVSTSADVVQKHEYRADLGLVGSSVRFAGLRMLACNLTMETHDGRPILGVIGRDVLASGVLTYDGRNGKWSWALDPDSPS